MSVREDEDVDKDTSFLHGSVREDEDVDKDTSFLPGSVTEVEDVDKYVHVPLTWECYRR